MDKRPMLNQIFLLTINSKQELYSITSDKYSAIQQNIYMGLLGSYIKSKGIAVEIIEETCGLTINELCEYIHKYSPKLIGVVCSGANPSSSTMSMVGAIKFFNEFNKNKGDIKTFICGGHPTVLPERTLNETGVDFVIRGEGYETIVKLYNNTLPDNLEGIAFKQKDGTFFIGNIPSLIDVNTIPMIDWHTMNPAQYRCHNWHAFGAIDNRSPYGVIWTSFGCPYKCSFCCINNLFGANKYRLRDIESVLKEIDILVNKYHVRNIKILDELFIMQSPRVEQFIEGLKSRGYDLNMWAYARMDTVNPQLLKKLRSVGMRWVAYGMESVSQRILDAANKGSQLAKYNDVVKMTKDAGLYICADFIVGLWDDDYDTLQETYDFSVKHNFEWFNVYQAFAYPGTELYKEYIKLGRIKEPESWEEYALYGYNCKPLPSAHLTPAQILKWRDDKFREYHSRPEYISMIIEKFGQDTASHILEMAGKPLKRKII
jgi:radical SAM superfamily enzyme YgiQ (UPF0313 family)